MRAAQADLADTTASVNLGQRQNSVASTLFRRCVLDGRFVPFYSNCLKIETQAGHRIHMSSHGSKNSRASMARALVARLPR